MAIPSASSATVSAWKTANGSLRNWKLPHKASTFLQPGHSCTSYVPGCFFLSADHTRFVKRMASPLFLRKANAFNQNGRPTLDFVKGEVRLFAFFSLWKSLLLFLGKHDFAAVPVAVWLSTFLGQKPDTEETVPKGYGSFLT